MANVYGFDPVAWSIDGGRHPGDLLRLVAYAATNGAEGIVSPGDCKVHQLGASGAGQIVIDGGALLIRNRSGNTRNQTYAANGRAETRLDVQGTTSSGGRHDAVIVRIEDPQFSPWPTPPVEERADYRYVKPFIVQNVGSTVTSAADLNLGYSAVMLARLDIPANTTIITDSMIKDMRQLAQPRSLYRMYGGQPYGQQAHVFTPANASNFYSLPQIPRLEVPAWATHWDISAMANVQALANSQGAVRLTVVNPTPAVNSVPINWAGGTEINLLQAADLGRAIPVGVRGKTPELAMQVRVDAGQLAIIGWGMVTFQVAFYERAV